MIARVRAHPVAAAGLLAVLLALPFVAAKVVLEGYPAPLVLLISVFVTASLFAFIVVVGAYLRVVARCQTTPPAWLFTVVVACTAGTVAFAFHDSLLDHQTVTQLSALYFGAGIAAGTVSLTLQMLWRLHASRTPPIVADSRSACGLSAKVGSDPGTFACRHASQVAIIDTCRTY